MKMPFKIIGGPEKDQMYRISEFVLCPKNNVCFILEGGTTVQIEILLLWHEDRDITHYNFNGRCLNINGYSYCEGSYDADDHTGAIQFQ